MNEINNTMNTMEPMDVTQMTNPIMQQPGIGWKGVVGDCAKVAGISAGTYFACKGIEKLWNWATNKIAAKKAKKAEQEQEEIKTEKVSGEVVDKKKK